MTNEPKDTETTETEGGIPEWGKQLQQTVQELAESLKAHPAQETQNEIPVPAEPNHQEPEVIIEPEQPEQEQEQPQKQNPLKSLLAWLM